MGYMNSSYSIEELTAYLMKVDILPAGDTDEVWLHLINKSQEMYQFVFAIGIDEDEALMRSLPLINVNKPITIKGDGIYQGGNKFHPLTSPEFPSRKARIRHYHGIVKAVQELMSSSNRGFGEGWENGEVYEIHATSEVPHYYKGDKLYEDIVGYFTSFEIEVDSCFIEFSIVDEDVNLYAVDAIFPSPFAYLVLNSLEKVDLGKPVYIDKDGVFQDGICLSDQIVLSDEEYIEVVERFKKRIDKVKEK